MFGEADILFKRNRLDSYTTRCDCFLLKLERNCFETLLEEFSMFRNKVKVIALAREKMRLNQNDEAGKSKFMNNEYEKMKE